MARLPKGLNPKEFVTTNPINDIGQRWRKDALSSEEYNASANLEGPGMGGWTTHVTKGSDAQKSALKAMADQYMTQANGASFTPFDVNTVPSDGTFSQGNTTPFKSQLNRSAALGDVQNAIGDGNRKSTFGLAQSGINMQPEIGVTQSKTGVKPARPLEEGNAPKKMNDFVAALNLEKETPTGLTAYNAPNAAEFLMKHKPFIEKKARKEANKEKPIQAITPWEGPMEGRPKGGGRGKEFEGGNAGSDWWYSPEVGGRGKEPVAEGRPRKTKGNRRDNQQWPPIQLFGGGIG